tara:strand:- start:570 stop:1367 length:798 start_codon:yes stop_codon:yes gene_type:complete
MSSDSNKCIVSDFGGHAHPYGYCVKPMEQMIDWGKYNSGSSMNLNALQAYAGGAINYATSLVSDPTNALAYECLQKLGNKYLLKTNSKCSNGNYIHKYINNMQFYNIITQRPSTGNDGIIPAAVGSATKINALGIFEAIVGESIPECVKVQVPCHLVYSNEPEKNYFGYSPQVYITKDDYNKIKSEGMEITLIEDFTNINNDINNNDNDNNNNYNDNNNNDNDNDLEIFSKYNNIINDNILINTYLLLITLFLMYLIFKLLNKKK